MQINAQSCPINSSYKIRLNYTIEFGYLFDEKRHVIYFELFDDKELYKQIQPKLKDEILSNIPTISR